MKDGFKHHAIEYRHDGATWVIEVPATSESDAWQRVCRMQEGTYLGSVVAVVPAQLGWFVRLACWVQNRVSRERP